MAARYLIGLLSEPDFLDVANVFVTVCVAVVSIYGYWHYSIRWCSQQEADDGDVYIRACVIDILNSFTPHSDCSGLVGASVAGSGGRR